MPPVTQLDTPPSSPKSPARKKQKFSLTLKRSKVENRESTKEKLYPLFSSPPENDADSCSTAELLCLPLPHGGLVNHGNICYANAVLQVLRHCPGFVDSVESTSRRSESLAQLSLQAGNMDDGAGRSLVSLVSNLDKLLHSMEMTESDYSRTKDECEHLLYRRDRIALVTDPLCFMDCFREVNPMFQGHLQHDSQEFLCTLLVNIQDAIRHIDKTLTTDEDAKNMATSLIKKPVTEETCDQNMQPEKLDFIGKMFQGRLVIQTKCLTCEGAKKRYEDFQNVSVPVEKENPAIDPQKIHHFSPAPKAEKVANKPTLSRALSQFAAVDYLYGDNKYFCESCCTHTEAQITTHFDVLPEVFTVHFKRFKADSYFGFASGWVNKITSNLETPVKLSLKQWCSQSCSVRDNTYELFGIVMHSGTASCSGHYQAYVKVTGDEARHTDENQSNGGSMAGATLLTEQGSLQETLEEGTGSVSQNHKADTLNGNVKAVSNGQSSGKCIENCNDHQTRSSQSPQNSAGNSSPASTPKSLKSGITKYFHKLTKNPSKLARESDSSGTPHEPKQDTDSNLCGEHSNTENETQINRDSVKKIHSFAYQTPKRKSSTNRKLQYEDERGSDLVEAMENDSHAPAESEDDASDDDIRSSLTNGDELAGLLSGWFHFDDTDVYTLQDSEVASVLSSADSSFTCPYLLFYRKVASL